MFGFTLESGIPLPVQWLFVGWCLESVKWKVAFESQVRDDLVGCLGSERNEDQKGLNNCWHF